MLTASSSRRSSAGLVPAVERSRMRSSTLSIGTVRCARPATPSVPGRGGGRWGGDGRGVWRKRRQSMWKGCTVPGMSCASRARTAVNVQAHLGRQCRRDESQRRSHGRYVTAQRQSLHRRSTSCRRSVCGWWRWCSALCGRWCSLHPLQCTCMECMVSIPVTPLSEIPGMCCRKKVHAKGLLHWWWRRRWNLLLLWLWRLRWIVDSQRSSGTLLRHLRLGSWLWHQRISKFVGRVTHQRFSKCVGRFTHRWVDAPKVEARHISLSLLPLSLSQTMTRRTPCRGSSHTILCSKQFSDGASMPAVIAAVAVTAMTRGWAFIVKEAIRRRVMTVIAIM